ncbi:efflux RND transporter periplasmic adaptor subunit [Shewanella maritima]|uniref:efflux RND transporter periplasmic adaptor subunit n=1 Tax=Shewanella maritima TaxID=2520507 RepID=UPI0037369780
MNIGSGLLLGLALFGCSKAEQTVTESVHLQTVSTQSLVMSAQYSQQQTYTGIVKATNTTGIGFELAGKLNSILVDSGDEVKQGQVLATLDISLLQAEEKQLKASLQQTQSDIDLALSNLERVTKLSTQNYASAQQLDENQQRVQNLKANKLRLQASLQATELKLEKSSLIAPFNGRISKRQHNLGEVVALGSPVFKLIGEDAPLAYIGVPVQVAQSLKQHQQVSITVGDQAILGSIAGISAEVDAITRTVQLRIQLPNTTDIINGEIAYLNYEQPIQTAGFWIPISALTDGVRGLWNVYVVTKDEQGSHTIGLRDVEIIYTNDAQAYVNGAITEGDHIITAGLHKLVAGQTVSVTEQLATEAL